MDFSKDQKILDEIAAEYGIATPLVSEKINKGFSSENYKITAANGVFFLKKHRGSTTVESISGEVLSLLF